MDIFKQKTWSPFAVGALIGTLMVASFYFTGKFLGISSAFVEIATIFSTLISHQAFSMVNFWQENIELVTIAGVIIGAFLSSYFSDNFTKDLVPSLWSKNFGNSFSKRALFAFIGGVIIIFGARLAGGCTSGKSIASGLQLIVPAWIFTCCLFAAASVTAFLLYRNK